MQIDDHVYERRRPTGSQRQQQLKENQQQSHCAALFKFVVFRTCILGLALILIESWILRGLVDERGYSTYNSFNIYAYRMKKIQKSYSRGENRLTEHFSVKPWVVDEFNCVIHEFHV